MSYRRSLDSISEYKTISSGHSKTRSSLESSASDYTDYILSIPTSEANREQHLLSGSSSYLSWIESVNSDLFTNSLTPELANCDNIGGEWNNFWLNYNSARNKYVPDSFVCMITEDATDDLSDTKSNSEEQKHDNDNESGQFFYLSREELVESIKCCERLSQLLQNALERHDNKFNDNKSETFFASPIHSVPVSENSEMPAKASAQLFGNNCINTILSTGVTDIWKKVTNKRKDSTGNSEKDMASSKSTFFSILKGNSNL